MLNLADILEGCLQKKPQAQKALYARYSYTLMGICLRYANSHQEAEDILQDAFIKIFTNLKHYKGNGSFEGWLKKIVVSTAVDHYNQQKKKFNHIGYEAVPDAITETEDVLSKITTQELLSAIQELPQGYRLAINLYAIEGYSHQEISEMLQISGNTSRSQLAKGRRMLAAILLKRKLIEA